MTKRSDEIEKEIDGIRDRMRNRIENTAKEVSPRHLAQRVTGKEDPSAGEMLEWAAERARRNPISTALVALGLLGLATQTNERTRVSPRALKSEGRRVRGYVDRATEAAKGYVHDAADIAVEKVDDASHYVREGFDSAGRSLSRSAREAELAARQASERSLELGREGAEWVKRNPTATGLFALAVGAAAASFLAARSKDDPVLARFHDDEDDQPVVTRSPRRKAPSRPSAAKATAAKATGKTGTRSKPAKATPLTATTKSASTSSTPAARRKAVAKAASSAASRAARSKTAKPASQANGKPDTRTASTATPSSNTASNSTPTTAPVATPERDNQIH
jgi:hypothetical protein